MDIDRNELTNYTDEQIEEAFDVLGFGLSVEDLAFGRADEIESFRKDRHNWQVAGKIEKNSDDVFWVSGAQAVKGQRRRDVVIIRLGKHCAIYGLDN